MIRYQSQLRVERPPSEVFATVSDIARWSEWTDMREIGPDSDGPLRVGSTGSFTLATGPFRGPIRYEAIALEPGRHVRYRLSHRAFDWTADIVVEPSGQASAVTSEGQFQLLGWRRVLQPFVGGEVARAEAAELVRLKAILEGRGQ